MRDDDAEQLPPVTGIEDERGINPTSLRFVFSFKNRAEDTCSHTSNASHCRKPESCFMMDELFLWCGRLSASCALCTTSLQKMEGGGGGGGRGDMKESFSLHTTITKQRAGDTVCDKPSFLWTL